MGNIIAKPKKSQVLYAWVEIEFYWPGTIEFLSNKRCISLFLSEKTHHCEVDYVKNLVEEFPKLFSNINFYIEEDIKKVTLDISIDYDIEFK